MLIVMSPGSCWLIENVSDHRIIEKNSPLICSLSLSHRHRAGPHPRLRQRALPLLPLPVGSLPAQGATPGSLHASWRRPQPPRLCPVWLGRDRVSRGAGGPRVRARRGVGVRRRVVGVVHPRRARERHIWRTGETFVIGSRECGWGEKKLDRTDSGCQEETDDVLLLLFCVIKFKGIIWHFGKFQLVKPLLCFLGES